MWIRPRGIEDCWRQGVAVTFVVCTAIQQLEKTANTVAQSPSPYPPVALPTAPAAPLTTCGGVHYYVSDSGTGTALNTPNYPAAATQHAHSHYSSHPYSHHLAFGGGGGNSGSGVGGGPSCTTYPYPFSYNSNHPSGAYAHFVPPSGSQVSCVSSPHFIALPSSASELTRRKMISRSPMSASWRSNSPWEIEG